MIFEITATIDEFSALADASCHTSGNYIYITARFDLNTARRNLESTSGQAWTVIDITDIDNIVYPTDL